MYTELRVQYFYSDEAEKAFIFPAIPMRISFIIIMRGPHVNGSRPIERPGKKLGNLIQQDDNRKERENGTAGVIEGICSWRRLVLVVEVVAMVSL